MAVAGAPPPENALIPSEATRSVDDCESSGGSGGLNRAIHFSSGNPRIEETRGVIHLYPQEEDPSPSSLAPLLPVERKPMVCVVAVPNHMTYADFCCFCASFFQQMLEMKVVRNDGMKDQYSILITFDGQSSADSFYQHFNGKRFSSLEVDICHVLYTLDVQYTGSIEHAQKSLPSAGEQPTCPVCLERLDQDTSGILTTICNHSFHSSCISKWTDSSCPVCRYCQQQPEKSTCSICGTSENLWICVICGFVGCGRYKEGHAIRHWKETQHCYSLDLESQRVWDYVGDNYVHRLIHSKSDGNPVELNFQCAHADDVCGVCECGADSAVSEALINSKLDAEYNNLLASQVEDQRKYYNLFLQESKVEQEKEISETIEKALHSKLQKLQAKLENCLQEKRFLGDINENLKKNQDMWKEKIIQIEEREQAAVRLRNEKIQTLEEQHRRLIVQIEAPESVDELPGSPSDDIKDDPLGDIKGGKMLPVPNTSSSRSKVSKHGTRNGR